MATLRCSWVLVVAVLALASGCTRLPSTGETPLKPETIVELRGYLRDHKPDLEEFRLRGPFAVTVEKDHEMRLSPGERITMDLYLAAPAEKAPLVIFLHGHDSSKEAHAFQAAHVASWGFHGLALQLPNNGQWISNGRTLARIASFIYHRPEVIDSRIDVNKIVLVGHSFGGTAVAIALAEGAPAVGGILLDPATVGRDLPRYLRLVNAPVLVLGADPQVSKARNRDYFFRFIRSSVVEVSIKDASHEDAQYPSEYSLQNLGFDPYTTEALQISFVSTLTSAAFSLSTTGTFDYAWASFGEDLKNGKLFNAKRK